MIVYLASDLLWATRIKSTADALGLACRPVRSVEMLDARLADSEVGAVLVDLDASETALALIRRIREHDSASGAGRTRVLAFGPHVAKELFQLAREAGADDVLPRGALAQNLPDALLRLSAGAS